MVGPLDDAVLFAAEFADGVGRVSGAPSPKHTGSSFHVPRGHGAPSDGAAFGPAATAERVRFRCAALSGCMGLSWPCARVAAQAKRHAAVRIQNGRILISDHVGQAFQPVTQNASLRSFYGLPSVATYHAPPLRHGWRPGVSFGGAPPPDSQGIYELIGERPP